MKQKNNIFPLTKDKSPAVPKGTDWRTFKGDVNTDLIGVPIPRGVIVFDLDTYKGVTCEDVERLFNCGFAWDDAEIQKTLKGGVHYAFSVPDFEFKNGTNVLDLNGFDTRSAGKGYIATGKGYEDLTLFGVIETINDPANLPPLPEQAIELLREGIPVDDDDLLSLISSQPLDIDDSEVELYMSKLDSMHAENSDTWLRVMFALYHQTGGSDKGWELFDTFSALCPEKYDAKKNRARWESCARSKKANPITFASVIDMVGGREVVESDKFELLKIKVFGCETKEQLRDVIKEGAALNLDTLNTTIFVKSLMKQFKEILGETLSESQVRKILKAASGKKGSDYYEDYVFVTATGEYMHKTTKVKMGPRSFDVKYNRLTPSDSDGNPQTATNYVNNRIECVHDGMYAPSFDDIFEYDGVEYFNTFRPTTLKRVKCGQTDIVDRIVGHISHLLPKLEERELVIDYLAHNVQYPGKKLHWGMILQGVQGDGKSFLAEMMKHVLGHSNCRTVTVESLDEKFTPWAEGNCMVFIEELKLDNYRKYETLNKLKPYIANPTVSVRRMQKDVYECINTTNYFALTNYKDALPLDDNDRRYCVLFSQWQSKEKLTEWMQLNPDYYQKLYDDMRKNAGEILDWLLSHKIAKSFFSLSRAPDTDAKRQMVDMAKSDDYLTVEDAINEFKCWDINEHVLNVTKLQQLIDNSFDSDYSNFPKTARLKNILLDMGYHNIGRYKTRGEVRKNQLIYCKDDQKKALDFVEEDLDFAPF